ncbi:helix-turn-helix domain-containing protein [Gordoniibacillus kamchatkensis]|uniref:helix-turn-helix domain-containing protein n=1 Tax=Gordoniibacillus kamchatkensis TaxID=1590651 RepID=UPI00069811B0|nr:AraC family transcriptional regulator [Paenibacillus sp. VKM B-2647]
MTAAVIREVESGNGPKVLERREIVQSKAFIEANLHKSLSLSLVAEEVGLSAHYLSRLFREETGCSFHDYVTQTRIKRAVHLLRTTSMRVYEVANAVGMPSYRYFSATFREHTGASPTEYKRG